MDGKMSLFCLGFGFDVDYSFLDKMSKENKGMARRIFEGSDATLQLKVEDLSNEHVSCCILPQLLSQDTYVCLFQGFYEEVSSPLLLDVDLRYPDNAVDLLTTNHFNQLFNGTEIVVAGQLMGNDMDNFLVEVNGQGVRRMK